MGPLSLGGRLAPNPEHTRAKHDCTGRDQKHVGSVAHVLNLSPPLPPRALGGETVASLCAIGTAARRFVQPPVLKPLNK